MQNNTKPQIMFAVGWLTIIMVTWLIMSSRAEASEIELQSSGNGKWTLRWHNDTQPARATKSGR